MATATAIPGVPSIPGITSDQRNAIEGLNVLMESYGLGDLSQTLTKFIQQGYDANSIQLLIQQTPEWKQRFAGNEIRLKSGMAVLDPGTYLDLERQYQNVLNAYGVPQGMFGRSDFANWIGKDVSPSEISGRAQLAAQAVYSSDPYFRAALSQFHGVDVGHLTAYYLDQSRALPFLQQQSSAAQIGAAALRNHLGLDENTAMTLASMGVSADQAQSGYSQIAKQLPRLQELAQTQGRSPFTQGEAEQATLFGNATAQRYQQQIINTEQAKFSGSGGVGTSFYHPDYGLMTNLQGQF